MGKREKVYLKDTAIWDSIDHSASEEQFPETYAILDGLTQGSRKNLVWKCSSGHSWEARIGHRSDGHGCPFCSGRRATDANRLSINNPELAREWDSDKNELTPYDVTASSGKKAWWKCAEGHSWQSKIDNRSRGKGCPFCGGKLVSDANRLSINRPELVGEWDFRKNEFTPDDVSVHSNKEAWWVCAVEGHSWQEVISHRSKGYGCPFCSGHRVSDVNRLSIIRPELVGEWDSDKNELAPDGVSFSSNQYAWWVCEAEGHSWRAKINNRSNGRGCPFCSGHRVSDSNRLSINRPELSREWDFVKNGLTPYDVSVSSNKKAWWKCAEGHSWRAPIYSRSKGQGCPKCAKRASRIEKRFIEVFTERTDFTVTAHGMRLNQISYSSGRSGVEVDIILYRNGHYLLLEYDGAYWHRDKTDLDVEKSQLLLSLGDNILHARIRENDLPNLDLAHDRFAQFQHDYHRSESGTIEGTVQEIETWFLEKIGV